MKSAIDKKIEVFNYYRTMSDINRSEYMHYLHDIFTIFDVGTREMILKETMELFPETVAFALLSDANDSSNISDMYPEEYSETQLKSFLDNIETDLIVGFGDVELFLTYARLYKNDVLSQKAIIGEKIRKNFIELKRGKFVWKKNS